MRITCLDVDIIQRWFVSYADPLWRCINSCQGWDAIVILNEGQGHRTKKSLYTPLVGLSSQRDGYCLNSFWNNRAFLIFMIKTAWLEWSFVHSFIHPCISLSICSLFLPHFISSHQSKPSRRILSFSSPFLLHWSLSRILLSCWCSH